MSNPTSRIEARAHLPDPRSRRGQRHSIAILSLAVLAMLSGCKAYSAIAQLGRDRGFALAHVLGYRRGKTPAASTFATLFAKLDGAAFEAVLARWSAARLPAGETLPIALDGKTARSSRDGEAPGQHLVAAYAPLASRLDQIRMDARTPDTQ